MWIVKLGGSLHDAPALRQRLAELATLPGPARIVVPGGGPFADAVRVLQPALAVDDLAAHRMAILAMQQFGLALQGIEPRLALAETEAELRAAKAAVWLPWASGRAGAHHRGKLGRHFRQPRLLARDAAWRQRPGADEIGRVRADRGRSWRMGCRRPGRSGLPGVRRPVRRPNPARPPRPVAVLPGITGVAGCPVSRVPAYREVPLHQPSGGRKLPATMCCHSSR